MASKNSSNSLKIVTFNMHGFNQGQSAIAELIDRESPDIFMLQEHWLTPANLCKYDMFSDYFSFGCSAMAKQVESGLLVGRPFGGVIIMVKMTCAILQKLCIAMSGMLSLLCLIMFSLVFICPVLGRQTEEI